MARETRALPKDVLTAIEGRIRLIGDARADAMRRIAKNGNTATAWKVLSEARKRRTGPHSEELVSILYRAIYEAGFILERPEMMTRGEARKIVEGLELLAKREDHLFLSPRAMSDPGSLLFLLERYRLYAQEIPTGARRRPEARSLATRICSIFEETVGEPCHEATAALIRASQGGNCDAETVRTYVSKGRRPRK